MGRASSVAPTTRRVVYAALAGNLLVAATKLAAALWTGSSAMLSEAVHSLVDTGNELLLLYGMRRAGRRPDPDHPIGYGRELYFWSFIVALLVFAFGAGVSIYVGVQHVRHPEPIVDPLVNYIVLAAAFVFEGAAWWVSFLQFRGAKGSMGYYEAFRRSKDPPSFMVLFENTADLAGILLAGLGTYAASRLHLPELDGVASILIGIMLAAIAGLLTRESKSLLIGERADPILSESILRIAEAASPLSRANGVLTVQLAPDQVLAGLSLQFPPDLRASEVEESVIDIERQIRAAHPEVVTLFIKPQTDATWKQAVRLRFGLPEPHLEAAAATAETGVKR
ncbi:MAG: cation diffusion facilitator family transporter [Caldimonas sp.]